MEPSTRDRDMGNRWRKDTPKKGHNVHLMIHYLRRRQNQRELQITTTLDTSKPSRDVCQSKLDNVIGTEILLNINTKNVKNFEIIIMGPDLDSTKGSQRKTIVLVLDNQRVTFEIQEQTVLEIRALKSGEGGIDAAYISGKKGKVIGYGKNSTSTIAKDILENGQQQEFRRGCDMQLQIGQELREQSLQIQTQRECKKNKVEEMIGVTLDKGRIIMQNVKLLSTTESGEEINLTLWCRDIIMREQN